MQDICTQIIELKSRHGDTGGEIFAALSMPSCPRDRRGIYRRCSLGGSGSLSCSIMDELFSEAYHGRFQATVPSLETSSVYARLILLAEYISMDGKLNEISS